MPIRTQNDLPAKAILENENIFVMDENRAMHQDIRPLEIAILNLMPLKEDTEVQLLRALSNTPLQVNITFLQTESYVSTHTAANHLNQFYLYFRDVKDKRFDGMIITGAPIEHLDFEEVDYWKELTDIMDWSKTNVTSTLHICWGAQAGLYYHYGIQKHLLPKKLSGIYKHTVMHPKEPLFRGFDDEFFAPHSRYTGIDKQEILDHDVLYLMSNSEEAGPYIISARGGRQIFVLGHSEYDADTLAKEYERDVNKGINPDIPVNYFQDDDPSKPPMVRWRSHAMLLYTNWLNYYVYQSTPFDITRLT